MENKIYIFQNLNKYIQMCVSFDIVAETNLIKESMLSKYLVKYDNKYK